MRISAAHETYAQAESFLDTNVQRVMLLLLFAGLVVFPFLADQYWIYLACLVAIHIVGTTGLNILTGYTGLISVGQAAFMSVGAYTVAILEIHVGTPFIFNLIAAGVVAAPAHDAVAGVQPAQQSLRATAGGQFCGASGARDGRKTRGSGAAGVSVAIRAPASARGAGRRIGDDFGAGSANFLPRPFQRERVYQRSVTPP